MATKTLGLKEGMAELLPMGHHMNFFATCMPTCISLYAVGHYSSREMRQEKKGPPTEPKPVTYALSLSFSYASYRCYADAMLLQLPLPLMCRSQVSRQM